MREEVFLDGLPVAQMSLEEFGSHTIFVGFSPNANAASSHRVLLDEQGEAMIRQELQRVGHRFPGRPNNAALDAMADQMINGLSTMPLKQDVNCNRIPGGRMVVLASRAVLARWTQTDVLRELHRREVDEAHRSGHAISPENLEVYRLQPPEAVTAASLQH